MPAGGAPELSAKIVSVTCARSGLGLVARCARLEPGHGGTGTLFDELLEQLEPHLAHRRNLLGEALQLIHAVHALHRLGNGIDIDIVRPRHIGQAQKAARLFRRAFHLDVDFHDPDLSYCCTITVMHAWQSPRWALNTASTNDHARRTSTMGEMTTIATLDGEAEFPVYIATPDEQTEAAIIVIPEIFGVNAGIRKKCDDWAALGYVALAPDIFWRFAPGVQLDSDVPEQFQEALGYFGQYNPDLGVQDIEAAIHWLRHEQAVDKVGLVGFCLGGRMAYMAAARTDIDASVGYYGVMIDQMLGEAHAIANPLMLHIPTADHFVGPEAQAAIHGTLDSHPKVVLHDYAGLDHGFAAEMGSRRDEAGAALADQRTRDFFKAHLA